MDCDSGMVFHSLFRAHWNAVNAGMLARGLGDIGSPRLLETLCRCLEQGKVPSQRELADQLHVSPATIANSLKSLERNGYVERQVDPADSRRNLISPTSKAAEALKASLSTFCAVDEAMFSGFTQEEIQQLNQYHTRMLENLYRVGGRLDEPCSPPPFPPQVKEEP